VAYSFTSIHNIIRSGIEFYTQDYTKWHTVLRVYTILYEVVYSFIHKIIQSGVQFYEYIQYYTRWHTVLYTRLYKVAYSFTSIHNIIRSGIEFYTQDYTKWHTVLYTILLLYEVLYSFFYIRAYKKYKVVQIWPGQTVTCLHTNSPSHIWTTLYHQNFSYDCEV
jgi:hypothetical protein